MPRPGGNHRDGAYVFHVSFGMALKFPLYKDAVSPPNCFFLRNRDGVRTAGAPPRTTMGQTGRRIGSRARTSVFIHAPPVSGLRHLRP